MPEKGNAILIEVIELLRQDTITEILENADMAELPFDSMNEDFQRKLLLHVIRASSFCRLNITERRLVSATTVADKLNENPFFFEC